MQDQFRASVQYDDFKGTVAADSSDNGGPEEYLRKKGLMNDDDFVIGIELWAGDHPGAPVSVKFLLVKGGFDTSQSSLRNTADAIATRRIKAEMSAVDFIGLFKRLNVVMSPGGMLTDRQYSVDD
jgi:hypothetical protein